MTKLYLPVARMGFDRDYFPIAEDTHEFQFFAYRDDAEKCAKNHLGNFEGDYHILEFKVKNAGIVPKRSYEKNYDWRSMDVRSPIGQKLDVKVEDTKTGKSYVTIAWRVNKRGWNWTDRGQIKRVPLNINILEWRLRKKKSA